MFGERTIVLRKTTRGCPATGCMVSGLGMPGICDLLDCDDLLDPVHLLSRVSPSPPRLYRPRLHRAFHDPQAIALLTAVRSDCPNGASGRRTLENFDDHARLYQ